VAFFSVLQEIPVQLLFLPMDDKCHILKCVSLRDDDSDLVRKMSISSHGLFVRFVREKRYRFL